MGQEMVYFLEAGMWVTKRLGSGGGQEANKMVDEEARSFSHRPVGISISANTGFLFW